MAKVVLESLEGLSEQLKAEYEARDGKFFLKLDGEPDGYVKKAEHAVVKGKLEEFRETNRKLMGVEKERDELKAKFEGVDPEEYKKLKDSSATTGVKTPEDVQAIVAKAVATAVGPLKTELETEKAQRLDREKKLADAKFTEVIGQAAAKAGAVPDAVEYLVGKARLAFDVTPEGEIKAKPDQFGSNGEPLTPEGWLKTAVKEHKFAFNASNGGGAGGGNGEKKGLQGKTLHNPSPQDLGKYSDQIMKGEITITTD